MNQDEALARMKGPSEPRGDACYGVFQVLVTSRCDGGMCSNCTQWIPYRTKEDMTLDNVRLALSSLDGYPGVIGIMGGNPCLHPEFPRICTLARTHVSDIKKRGIWSNNLNGHGDTVAGTFGYFNLNVHGRADRAAEMAPYLDTFRQSMPSCRIWGLDRPSLHGSVMADMSDFISGEAERWELIAGCDVNQRWSPAMVQLDGVLYGYICEIMAARDAVLGTRTGIKVADNSGWWKEPAASFADQICTHCHHCGVPLRMEPVADSLKTDDVSRSTVTLARERRRWFVNHSAIGRKTRELTDYQGIRK